MTLPDGTPLDVAQIESVSLAKRGAQIGALAVSIPAGDAEDLTTSEDVLRIRLKDGSEQAVRGVDAEKVYEEISEIQDDKRLDFQMTRKHP